MKPGGSNEEKISFYRRATEYLKVSYSEGGPRGKKENSSKRNRLSFDTILSQFLFSFLIYIIDTKE